MHGEVLVAWLAALFGLMAATLGVAAVLVSWPVLLVALPLGGTAVLLWFHASGRLEEQMRQHARRRRARQRRRAERDAARGPRGRRGRRASGAGPAGGAREGFGPGPGGPGPRGRGGGRFDPRRGSFGGGGARGAPADAAEAGMSRDRALSVLDLDAGADDAAIREAYRSKVKETHPDRGGDREAFVRVTDAYEALGGST